MKLVFNRIIISRTLVPLIVIQSEIAKNDVKLKPDDRIREKEKKLIKNKVTDNKMVYILSGPKHVGKSVLVNQIAKNDFILVDLRAKLSEPSIINEFVKNFNTFVDNVKVNFFGQVSVEFDMAKKNLTEQISAGSPPNFENIDIIIKAVLNHQEKKPSCLIIDEAQTLRYLEKSNLTKLLETLIDVGRKHSVSVLFVTSDYSSLIATIGMIFIFYQRSILIYKFLILRFYFF